MSCRALEVCGLCKNAKHEIWSRTYDDRGTPMVICRLCWESQYPCEQTANFVKIPYRLKCLYAWTLTTPVSSVTLLPGEYEIGVIDAYTDSITLWSYLDEVRPVARDVPTFLTEQSINKIRHDILKSSCSCEDGYIPLLTVYSYVKSYGILYRKDSHVKKKFNF